MAAKSFWHWYDRAARADFAANIVGWFWDWRTWALSTVVSAVTGGIAKWLDGWSSTGILLAMLIAFAAVALIYLGFCLFWDRRFIKLKEQINTPLQGASPPVIESEPTADIDAREAFFQIIEKSVWSTKQLVNPPDPRTARSDWLKNRLEAEIHNHLAQNRLTGWGETSLPFQKYPR